MVCTVMLAILLQGLQDWSRSGTGLRVLTSKTLSMEVYPQLVSGLVLGSKIEWEMWTLGLPCIGLLRTKLLSAKMSIDPCSKYSGFLWFKGTYIHTFLQIWVPKTLFPVIMIYSQEIIVMVWSPSYPVVTFMRRKIISKFICCYL